MSKLTVGAAMISPGPGWRAATAAGLLAIACGCAPSGLSQQGSGHEPEAHATQRAVFLVTGMDCKNCEREVRDAVAQLDGVLVVETSFSAHQVVVHLDPARVRPEAIEASIEKLGYEAVLRSGLLQAQSRSDGSTR